MDGVQEAWLSERAERARKISEGGATKRENKTGHDHELHNGSYGMEIDFLAQNDLRNGGYGMEGPETHPN